MLKKLALITLMGVSASAAMAGDWQVKVGGSLVDPTNHSNVAGLGKVEADYQYAFTPSVEYFFNDNLSTELLLAAPIKHDLKVNGKKFGSIKQLPPTLTVKYTYANSSPFTPYIGVGATGFFAWDAQDNDNLIRKVKNDVGVAGQIGVNFQPADAKNWGVFADVRYADLDPKVRLTNGEEFKLKLDPVIYTLGYSYRF